MTKLEPDHRQVKCPACDYDHGKPGRPEMVGDRAHCLDCGATWIELGASDYPPMEIEKPVIEDIEPIPNNRFEKSKAFLELLPKGEVTTSAKSGYTMKEGNRSALYLSSIAGLVLLSCLAASVYILQSFTYSGIDRVITSSVPNEAMRVSGIKLEEMVRHSGDKVFRVEGQIENRSSQTKVLPRLLIVLRNDRGTEIVRWHYKSPVKTMKAGRKIRFASSVQYDTPYAVSAEAYFE